MYRSTAARVLVAVRGQQYIWSVPLPCPAPCPALPFPAVPWTCPDPASQVDQQPVPFDSSSCSRPLPSIIPIRIHTHTRHSQLPFLQLPPISPPQAVLHSPRLFSLRPSQPLSSACFFSLVATIRTSLVPFYCCGPSPNTPTANTRRTVQNPSFWIPECLTALSRHYYPRGLVCWPTPAGFACFA